MQTSIPINLGDGKQLTGTRPVLIVGPNGSGKTRRSTQLAQLNGAEIISALRNIALRSDIPAYSPIQAKNNLENLIQQRQSNYWELSNEIDSLFAKLLAEDAAAAIRFRDGFTLQTTTKPDDTVLQQTRRLWSRVFPGRQLSFDSYTASVSSEYAGTGVSYTANTMSDGERVALYLAGRILNAKPGVVVIDEPELYFHSRLAVRFWDELELDRPDIRFVYITHDLPFALSRKDAQYVLINPKTGTQVLPVDQGLPQAVTLAILGAASFSIYARRIVFCEGTEGQASDYTLYRAWFAERGTAVIPVGSCKEVIRCTESFGSSKLVIGLSAIGIIDRDYWPDAFLASMPSGVIALAVHEVESLFCIRGVFKAVAQHLGTPEGELDTKYEAFLAKVRSQSSDSLITKQIAERCKRRVEPLLLQHVGGLKGSDDLATFEAEALAVLNPSSWSIDGAGIFKEEKAKVRSAIAGLEADLLAVLPGKPMIHIAAQVLGLKVDAYQTLVEVALRSKDQNMAKLKAGLEATLGQCLPPREYIEAV